MNNLLNFDAFLSVPFPASGLANQRGYAVDPPTSLEDGCDSAEGGPGLFRCMLICTVISLTCYGVAAWLIF